jgi:RNA-directed DNA polymerase
MNRSDNLMPVITSPANLLQAWRAIRGNIPRYRHKNCVGPDGVSLADFEQDLQCQLSVLRYELVKGKYKPKQPTFFTVAKKDGGERNIAVLAIVDRVAQRAVQQVVEPFWEQVFLPCSFGYRPGLSVKNAVDQASHLRSLGNTWVVNGDIDGFFENLDQKLLLKYFHSRIKDKKVVDLVHSWLYAGTVKTHFGQAITEKPKALRFIDSLTPQTWPEKTIDGINRPGHFEDEYLSRFQPGDVNAHLSTEGLLQSQTTQVILNQIFRQVLTGGLLTASGYAKNFSAQAIAALRNLVLTSPSRAFLKKVLLGTSCAAIASTAVAGYFVMAHNTQHEKGVLQGSPLSPLLANIYLHPFDCGLVRNGHYLVRYADDWLIMASTEEQAHQGYNEAIRSLARLHLKINKQKTSIVSPSDNIAWLGSEIQSVGSLYTRLPV